MSWSDIKDLGKLEDAELSARKAIELDPNSADAFQSWKYIDNLGKLRMQNYPLAKQLNLIRVANAYSNLGLILRDLEKLEEAEVFTRKSN